MWTELILSILGVFAIVIFTIFTVKHNKNIKSIDVTANMPIVENDYRKEFTDGHTLGVIKSSKLKKNGCRLVEFYPIDVEQGEDIVRPHLQSFVVKQEFYKPYSRGGDLSDHRERIKTVTRDPSRVPEMMRDTHEGKWATKQGQLGHIESTFRKAVITGGDQAIAEAMKGYARGNISAATLAELKSEIKEFRKTMRESSGEEPKKES